jgi:hypothetical protein
MSWGDDLSGPTGSLESTRPSENDMIGWTEPMTLSGSVDGAISVMLLIDDVPIETTSPTGGKFTITFIPSAVGLRAGSHTFVICGIAESGAISTIEEFRTGVKAPTAAATHTFLSTRSPTASGSASASWGEVDNIPWLDPNDNEAASSVNAPAIVIGLGVPIGIILIAAFSFLLWRYSRAVKIEMNEQLRRESLSQVPSPGDDF